MRLLANENVPGDVVAALRAAGHDVLWIRTDSPGAVDEDVLARAATERRVLLTFDKDFSELVFRRGAAASCGVVLLRLPLASPRDLASAVVAVVGSRSDWEGHFAVVERDRLRLRPLA